MNHKIQAITMLAKQLLRQKVTDLHMAAPPIPINDFKALLKELKLRPLLVHDHYEVHWNYVCKEGEMIIVLQSEEVGVLVFDHSTVAQN